MGCFQRFDCDSPGQLVENMLVFVVNCCWMAAYHYRFAAYLKSDSLWN